MDLVAQSKKSIKITSPYVKENICNEILSLKKKNTQLELITSFKMMNVYSGSLDLNGLENIIMQNGIVKNYQRLHSKIYVFDDEKAVVTSSNLTSGGLIKNFEYGIYIDNDKLVSEIANDFSELASNDDTGNITLSIIKEVRAILAKIPDSIPIKLPRYTIGDFNQEEQIQIEEQILTSSLSGWKLEVLKRIQLIPNSNFSLDELKEFENELSEVYPENHNIAAKIRQQLQYLRDLGLVEFLGNGFYKKLWK